MASLIQGYEYDIFISYRHNDNRSGWVTEFVKALQEEIAATIKEPISVYFDSNPHDGLLETHNVDKSLEGKLRCLIFIPIISQTYCDTKSFAWQHEFCAFDKLAKEDQFGRDIKLSNGNVASRILPVKIHALDADDKTLLENELGGVLRAIEFIYTSSGVNRPLTPSDNPDKNQNKTFYRDQVNKVANAIKEIITALKNRTAQTARTSYNYQQPTNPIRTGKTLIATISLILLLSVAGYFLYPIFFSSPDEERVIDKSIAVLPFADISETHDQAYFSDGMMIEILDHLFKIKDLRIIPRNSTLGYKDSTKPVKEIASELGVAHLIQGSVRKSGNRVKISVQLINGSNEQFLWQQTYDREIADVFAVQSDVASQIANALKAQITPDVKKRLEAIPTKNQEAYDLFLKGQQEFLKARFDYFNTSHVKEGIAYLNKAVALDSTFSDAFAFLGECYWFLAHHAPDYTTDYWRLSKKFLYKAIELDPQNGRAYSELSVVQDVWEWDKKAALQSLQKAVQLNPADINIYYDFMWFYYKTLNCDSMKVTLTKLRELNPNDSSYFFEIGIKICNQDERELQAMNPAKIISEGDLWMECARLLILKKNESALEKLEQYKHMESEEFLPVMKGMALGMAGKKPEALEMLRKLEQLSKARHIWPSSFAAIHMAIGDEKKAYEYLEKGIEQRDIWLHELPYYASFYRKRNDPKFQAFMERTWVPLKE